MGGASWPPAVTVVIPAFNASWSLPLLFDCLDRQIFRDFEVIFVDDGSTDGTGALLDAYAATRSHVKVIHQANGGPGKARNAGMDMAAGDYVLFIDADDAVSIHHIGDLHDLAVSLYLDVAMCSGWRFRETPGDCDSEPLVTRAWPQMAMSGIEWFTLTFNEGEWWGYPWMTLIRRDFLRREAIRFAEGTLLEDVLWNALVQSKATRVAYTPKQSYYYRKTPGSLLNDGTLAAKLKRINSYVALTKELWRMADANTGEVSVLYRRLAAYEGRILLACLAELGSLRKRIAVSRELFHQKFLARLFREVEIKSHRKRIARAYFFALLGEMVWRLDENRGHADFS